MTATAGAPVRVAFLGNDPWSVPVLDALAGSRHRMTVVLTRDPRPAGRGRVLTPTAVAEAAGRLGLRLVETPTVREGPGFEALAAADPDVVVVVAYGEILPVAVLDVARLMPLNVHLSLLPALRGAAPVQRAILEGLLSTGVTIMRMDEGIDTGPIIRQGKTAIGPDENAGALGIRLAVMGGRFVVETLDRLADGPVEELAQHGLATYAPKIRPEERTIDWSEPATRVVGRVRAFAPVPGATTRFRDRTLKVLRARAKGAVAGAPGSVVEASKVRFTVATLDGQVELLEVAPEGRSRMSGPEFVRGYRPEPGDVLG